MKKKYTGQEWTKNRAIYFQVGVILALLAVNKIINIETKYQDNQESIFIPTEDDPEIETLISARFEKPIRVFTPSTEIELLEEIPTDLPEIMESVPDLIDPNASYDENDLPPISTERLPLPEEENNIPEIVPNNKIYRHVEVMPVSKTCISQENSYSEQYECTLEEIRKVIQKYLKYPTVAKANGLEGTLEGSFIVNKKGEVVDMKVEKAMGHGFDEAVLKVLSKIPPFEPGKQNDMNVNVKMTIPIKFRLNN